MTEGKRKYDTKNTASFLLTKRADYFPDDHRVKIVIVGSGHTGVATAIAILFKRLASELVFIDTNDDLAKAEAEDIGHAAAFLGNPKIVGTKDYALARDAAVCVITLGDKSQANQDPTILLERNLTTFKVVVPNVTKYAPNSVLVIVTNPVDILSNVAMKLSGFPPNRVIGLGTFLDSCRFQYFIADKLGLAANSVQASIIGENGSSSVPIWSAVGVMGMKLKDINKEIGTKTDPEAWRELHAKVIDADSDIITRKGYYNWGVGICVSEIVDAIVRNTGICVTVSTYLKGCRHGLDKDVYMSLPCIIGRNGVQSLIRYLYTKEEQEMMENSCRQIYDKQKSILENLF
ncbi:L-lactate dehydrogenase A-like 6A [Polistes fuscatus]|uniref:L-lactate dehydrogenase A-like 6A n=1 Tax=Polistes fuscatus TaxID=30207 RepID=UPI001CA80456|nr:L-lactate dehydrogenase A-like 6A [Polistes fuscatus]